MPPPSQLSIATSAVQRLVKEEASYHKELAQQESRIAKLEANPDGDENAEYQLKQEKSAVEETKAIFPPLRQRIGDAVQKLEDQLQAGQESEAPAAELEKAKDVIQQAKAALSEEK